MIILLSVVFKKKILTMFCHAIHVLMNVTRVFIPLAVWCLGWSENDSFHATYDLNHCHHKLDLDCDHMCFFSGETGTILATCGGNTVCFIDVQTGLVMKRFKDTDKTEVRLLNSQYDQVISLFVWFYFYSHFGYGATCNTMMRSCRIWVGM